MNVNKYIISALVCPFVLGSCADWDDWKYDVEKPQTIAQYEYLNDYAPLKEYLDRNAHPGFKVSAALGVDEFNQQGPLFRLAAHNFDEIVAGNAMKMASCVNDQGVMDFSKVSSFVHAAEDAGLTVYGHALAWHAQQPSKYLNGLIADKPIPEAPGGDNQFIRYTTDKAGSNPWDNQATCKLATPLEKGGAYTLSMKVKASQDCDLDFGQSGMLVLTRTSGVVVMMFSTWQLRKFLQNGQRLPGILMQRFLMICCNFVSVS